VSISTWRLLSSFGTVWAFHFRPSFAAFAIVAPPEDARDFLHSLAGKLEHVSLRGPNYSPELLLATFFATWPTLHRLDRRLPLSHDSVLANVGSVPQDSLVALAERHVVHLQCYCSFEELDGWSYSALATPVPSRQTGLFLDSNLRTDVAPRSSHNYDLL
jgi:hypothetical protein